MKFISWFHNLWEWLKRNIFFDRVKVNQNSDGTVDFNVPAEKSTINGTEIEVINSGKETDLKLDGKSRAVNNGNESYDIYI